MKDLIYSNVIIPACKHIGVTNKNGIDLVWETGCTESHYRHFSQVGGGPALGLWQMEPNTHNDIWENVLKYREALAEKVRSLCTDGPKPSELMFNPFYAAAMCRVQYLRFEEAIPDDIVGRAHYYKKYYNTHEGKGSVEKYLADVAAMEMRA